MKKFAAAFLSLLLIFSFSACGSKHYPSKLETTTSEEQLQQPSDGDTVAVVKTSKGTIKIKLFPQYAPKRVENFTKYAQSGYYNDSEFCRVVENLLIQAGSPEGTQGTGKSVWDMYFTDEFTDKLHNYTGAVGMVNSGEDTNGAAFYIITTPATRDIQDKLDEMTRAGYRADVVTAYSEVGGAPRFDYRYTVFGQIYEGLDVAYEIGAVKTGEDGWPEKSVTIESIEIQTIGESEGE